MKYVVKWVYEDTPQPWLRLARRFCPIRSRSVSYDEWEANKEHATHFLSEPDAWAAYDRLGIAGRTVGDRKYAEVLPL